MILPGAARAPRSLSVAMGGAAARLCLGRRSADRCAASAPSAASSSASRTDPTCSPHVVQAGQGFVDDGHDTHVVRNEGSIDLVTVVVSLVPAGFERRIDEPAPANCPNLPQG
jgi:hypothetical protein